MRRRYVLALILAIALIFSLAGLGAGYSVWHEGEPNHAIVTNKTLEITSRFNGGEWSHYFCVYFRVEGADQDKCWTLSSLNRGDVDAPACWDESKIGASLPEVCR